MQNKKKVKPEATTTEEEDLEKYLPRVINNDEKSLQTIISNPTYQFVGVAALIVFILAVYHFLWSNVT